MDTTGKGGHVAADRRPVLLVSSAHETPARARVWGNGGWERPEDREALDWLVLLTYMGWGVAISSTDAVEYHLTDETRWLILATEPSGIGSRAVRAIESRMERAPLGVVARAAPHGSPLARLSGVATSTPRMEAGTELSWATNGRSVACTLRAPLRASELEVSGGATVWATLEERPLIVERRVGGGVVCTLGFQPSAARDAAGEATALLRRLLVTALNEPAAWFDLDGTLVLRMDDPGTAQNVHFEGWAYRELSGEDWDSVANELARRNARLSIGYCPGWVDDGDAAKGRLEVSGSVVRRTPGAVHPSPAVRYTDVAGLLPGTLHDYSSEYAGIQRLRARGLGDVELHGYTHMHPDHTAWATAANRHEEQAWYRELGADASRAIRSRPDSDHPLRLGVAELGRWFGGSDPTALICPGDEWTTDVLSTALDLGFRFVSSYYLATRIDGRFCWATQICAPYLDQPDHTWFASGLPVVGYFHDREVSASGVQWLADALDAWTDAGARRLIDFRELAFVASSRLRFYLAPGGAHTLLVTGTAGRVPAREVPVRIRGRHGRIPAELALVTDTSIVDLAVTDAGDGTGLAWIPPTAMAG